MFTSVYSILLLLVVATSVFLEENGPEVTIKQGTLRGTTRTTLNGRSVLSFQGIPYAEPPIGKKRFKAPVPLKAWDGILDATKEHNSCPQDDIFFRVLGLYGNEDCLYLNVYTPKISNDELLPVIVFIHGGGFLAASANPTDYGPNVLLDKDVVLVTTNYRLGALGFLSTEDDVLPGNNGLKDQNLALRWVKNNINKFGGNPEKITIFGQSAGGVSVHLHLLSPCSKDLLFAGISSSGVGVSQWALAQKGEALRNAKRLARYLNCPITCNQEMVDCLSEADSYDIVIATNKFYEINNDPGIPFKPVIEHNHKDAFLSEHPADIIRKGKMADVPFMTGITTDDGGMKSAGIYNDSNLGRQLNSDIYKYLPMILSYGHLHQNTDKFTTAIMSFYLGNKTFDDSTKAEFTDMVTDSLFLYPARVTTVMHAQYSEKPVYFYLFGYRGSTSTSTSFGDPEHDYGVVHCDDLIYLLSSDGVIFNPNEADKKMIELMTNLWYNFAKTGNPTPIDDCAAAKWDPVTRNALEYYFIKNYNDVTMEKNLYEERFQFWKNLGAIDVVPPVKNE